MVITKITPFLVDHFLLVRVYTDAGIVGNGEAELWAHHPTVAQGAHSRLRRGRRGASLTAGRLRLELLTDSHG